MNKLPLISLILLLFPLFSGCGSKDTPSGGPRDDTPLEIASWSPDTHANLSKANRLEIVFSKPVDRSTIVTGIRFYPEMVGQRYDWDDPHTLAIRFPEDMPDRFANTNLYVTLTRDLMCTHNNALAQQTTLVFARGDLQNAAISGNIEYERPEDRTGKTMLQLSSADSVAILRRPTALDAYRVEYLNPGQYRLALWVDKNDNFRMDPDSEPWWSDSVTVVNSAERSANLVYPDSLPPEATSITSQTNRQLTIECSEPIVGYSSIHITGDTLDVSADVLLTRIDASRIRLLTTPLDSIRYRLAIEGLTDLKGNVAGVDSLTFDAVAQSDTIPPVVLETIPRNGSTVGSSQPQIRIRFSELMRLEDIDVELMVLETGQMVDTRWVESSVSEFVLEPVSALERYQSCRLRILSTTQDPAQNPMAEEIEVNFIPVPLSNDGGNEERTESSDSP